MAELGCITFRASLPRSLHSRGQGTLTVPVSRGLQDQQQADLENEGVGSLPLGHLRAQSKTTLLAQ